VAERAGAAGIAGVAAGSAAAGTANSAASAAQTPVEEAWARSDRVLVDFIAERYRGTRPIAWGRQLQELWVTAGLYEGVLGLGSLMEADENGASEQAAATVEAPVAAAAAGEDGDRAPG
jgi:hypothetical protein